MPPKPGLTVVAYHYVRDLPRTRFPRIKGLLTDEFRGQVNALSEHCEMATLESALAFVSGRYRPTRHLCLLTFDDGLKEHYTDVLPLLEERRIQGVFFLSTSCLGGRVASVHKSHFLMAALDFAEYRAAFLGRARALDQGAVLEVVPAAARAAYPWDTFEVASLKYLANFQLPETLRDTILDDLFAKHLGGESEFAASLYLSWSEAREMQEHGMVLGGHAHEHVSLAMLDPARQRANLEMCADLLRKGLGRDAGWPFAYPYGGFNRATVEILPALGFSCAFALQALPLPPDVEDGVFSIRRLDTNDVRVPAPTS